MRLFLPVSLLAIALATALPCGAEVSVLDRPPMDLGADQTGTISQIGQDILSPPHFTHWWFDAGVSYPMGTLKRSNVDPGLLLRVNHQILKRDALGVVGSVAVHFGDDSYFNDAQEELARTAPVVPFGYSGVDIQSRYYIVTPMILALQVQPPISPTLSPFFSFGPGVIWSHSSEVTSAVNAGVGSVSLGGGEGDSMSIGPGGEQGISPYGIRTRTRFNLGWEAKAGIGFRMTGGDTPLWMRLAVTGTTYYTHTSPRTLLGFVASFGR
jgi:hypothetical protein